MNAGQPDGTRTGRINGPPGAWVWFCPDCGTRVAPDVERVQEIERAARRMHTAARCRRMLAASAVPWGKPAQGTGAPRSARPDPEVTRGRRSRASVEPGAEPTPAAPTEAAETQGTEEPRQLGLAGLG